MGVALIAVIDKDSVKICEYVNDIIGEPLVSFWFNQTIRTFDVSVNDTMGDGWLIQVPDTQRDRLNPALTYGKVSDEIDVKSTVLCSLCGAAVANPEVAAEFDWAPEYFDGDTLIEYACPECTEKHLRMSPSGVWMTNHPVPKIEGHRSH